MAKKSMTQRQQFWLAHIQAAMKSGEGLKRYANTHRLSLGALYNAKSVFKRAGLLKSPSSELAPSPFVPVQIAPQASVPIRCRLQHRLGWQLEMERLPDPAWVRELMRGDDAAA
jgi:hypothetical protein